MVLNEEAVEDKLMKKAPITYRTPIGFKVIELNTFISRKWQHQHTLFAYRNGEIGQQEKNTVTNVL